MAGDMSGLTDEHKQLLSARKHLLLDIEWPEDPQNSAHRVFSATLVDDSSATIPGITMELAYRTPVYANDCKYTFTLFAFKPGGGRQRIYQLEVVPPNVRSHIDEDGSLYGPHEHVGNTVAAVNNPNLGCKHHEAWFRIFLTKANIQFGAVYISPFEESLFDR